ncbi:hypothetical protein HYW42_00295 [Candidatus Daviesbacteria bacterium]|nr:hypothetical protein [Candidatus Daviesbacteria bacterium]
MAKNKAKGGSQSKRFHEELIDRMLALATSGFGLVAALAWNETIQAFVQDYIQKYFPQSYGLISKLLYAVLITIFAVFITYQLSKLSAKFNKP